MKIDFNEIEKMFLPGMNNGTGMMSAQMYDDFDDLRRGYRTDNVWYCIPK